MSDPALGLTMLALFLGFILLGFPIAFTLMAMGLFFGYILPYLIDYVGPRRGSDPLAPLLPDVDSIEGLSPAISIEQKTAGHNPRSTVGTVTEIYDYLRLLFARAGTPHCPSCGRLVQRQSEDKGTDVQVRDVSQMLLESVKRGL